MKELTLDIAIGAYQFFEATAIRIDSSWKFQADTAKITLARILFHQGMLQSGPETVAQIKVGDPVLIRAGYDYVFQTEFEGYVKSIQPNSPTVIECEDEMWQLKQTNFNRSWRQVELSELLAYIVPEGIPFKATGRIPLGKMRISEVSAFQVLESLQKIYGLVSYFKNGVLYVGFPYQESSQLIQAHMQHNIDFVATQLSYRTSDQVKLKIKAISIQPNGTKVEVEVGDQDGQLRTLHLPIGLNETEAKRVAEEKRSLFTFDGYDGQVTTYGQPFAQHSDRVEITDQFYPNRGGIYRIDAVTVTIGSGGYRRALTLGPKTQ